MGDEACFEEGAIGVKINIRQELERFKAEDVGPTNVVRPDLLELVTAIIVQIQDLKKTDLQVAASVREMGSQLQTLREAWPQLGESKTRPKLSPSNPETKHAVEQQVQVLYAIYDRIESELVVARSNQDPVKEALFQPLFEYIQASYGQELGWIRMEPIGQTYNPAEHDGFVVGKTYRDQAGERRRLKIVNELRAGFTCRGQVIRKPVVEFLE
jgi:hypothetical protein